MTVFPVLRTGARMNELDSESCALVLTSPPYFPQHLEETLTRAPRSASRLDALAAELIAFAYSLRDVFEDCARVLAPGRALIIQTRDVRVHDWLIPTSVAHRSLLESCGFRLFTRYFWLPDQVEPDRLRESKHAVARGTPRPPDPEEFMIFLKPNGDRGVATARGDSDLASIPLLRSTFGRMPRPHRHRTPYPICEKFIGEWTDPSEIVADPFMGNGTVLVAAQAAGRVAYGYDIDESCVDAARVNLGQLASDA